MLCSASEENWIIEEWRKSRQPLWIWTCLFNVLNTVCQTWNTTGCSSHRGRVEQILSMWPAQVSSTLIWPLWNRWGCWQCSQLTDSTLKELPQALFPWSSITKLPEPHLGPALTWCKCVNRRGGAWKRSLKRNNRNVVRLGAAVRKFIHDKTTDRGEIWNPGESKALCRSMVNTWKQFQLLVRIQLLILAGESLSKLLF